ncbi:MAG TPA: hypothetical protein VGS28_03550 [Candidatus Saccharimonadales bacterium]|nr:hypothetical protein [Candidatus Saccharimonadales bacterium]
MFQFKDYEHNTLEVIRTDRADYIESARRLQAEVYLKRNFVAPSDIEGGVLSSKADPYAHHSQYFVVIDRHTKEIVATARQIRADKKKGISSFPIVGHVNLYIRAQHMLSKHRPEECVEISALAKQYNASSFAPLLLYRAMWHHSLVERDKIWFMACDPRLYERLRLLFGPAIQKAGPVTAYPGADVVPAILKVGSSLRELERALRKEPHSETKVRRRAIQFLLHGLPTETLSRAERQAYESLKG